MSPTEHLMNQLAAALDQALNGELKGEDRTVAFVLLTANFTPEGETNADTIVNYVSNGQRANIVTMLKNFLARMEGRVDPEPSSVQ